MERFTISLDEALAKQFDQLIAARGYSNRSEAVRDLIRGAIESDRQRQTPSGHCVANLSYVYNHHERELAERLTGLQHNHHDLTVAAMHSHLDHDNCLESGHPEGGDRRCPALCRYADGRARRPPWQAQRHRAGSRTSSRSRRTRRPPMSITAPPAEACRPTLRCRRGAKQAWIEVIQKMDEVYNDLLQYEVALEEKNAALEESHQFIESVLASMTDILIVCDRNGTIEEVNPSLAPAFLRQVLPSELVHTPLFDLFADEVEKARVRDIFYPLSAGKACTIANSSCVPAMARRCRCR